MRYVIAIDPGTMASGVCIVRKDDFKPMAFGKLPNGRLMMWIDSLLIEMSIAEKDAEAVIERMESHGQMVGSDTFITCEFIGYFTAKLEYMGLPVSYVKRFEEKRLFGHNDAEIKRSLVDRFAYGQPNFGKGTKKEPGWFHGFKEDIWSAYAVAVTYIDREASNDKG